MSATCALCAQPDWLDVGICAACAGTKQREFVFLVPRAGPDHAAVADALHDLLAGQFTHDAVREVARGRQPLALLPPPFAQRAVQLIRTAQLDARILTRRRLHHALPVSFIAMLLTMLLVAVLGALRDVTVLLVTAPVVAAALLCGAWWQLRSPLMAQPASTSLLPDSVRASLAAALAGTDDIRARAVLTDVARLGEAAFAALPTAFRTASLGQSIRDLLAEAGPLAAEAAHLRAIATDLGTRSDPDSLAEALRIDDAANDRFALLEHVLALLGRLARENTSSDLEIRTLINLVRDEATRRFEAERVVATLLQPHR